MTWGYCVGLIVLSELVALVGLTVVWSVLSGSERRQQTP